MLSSLANSQSLAPFCEAKKWGLKNQTTIVVKPEYDTIFDFNKKPLRNLVTNKSNNALFDAVNLYNQLHFYIIEKYTKVDGERVHIQGIIDEEGKLIIPCKYKHITVNTEDSIIYCCSAVYNNYQLSDDAYNYQGKLIYTNKKHIEFSSKKIHVYKLYEPKERFIIENDVTKDSYGIEGERFKYLKNNKALVRQGSLIYVVDLLTGKKNKLDKFLYASQLCFIFGN